MTFLFLYFSFFYIYSTGYSSMRTNETILLVFLKNNHRSKYRYEMTILLLNLMGFNYFKDAPHFCCPYLEYFLSWKHGTKWTQKLDSFCKRINIFIFRIQVFFYHSSHSLRVLKNVFWYIKKDMPLWVSKIKI